MKTQDATTTPFAAKKTIIEAEQIYVRCAECADRLTRLRIRIAVGADGKERT